MLHTLNRGLSSEIFVSFATSAALNAPAVAFLGFLPLRVAGFSDLGADCFAARGFFAGGGPLGFTGDFVLLLRGLRLLLGPGSSSSSSPSSSDACTSRSSSPSSSVSLSSRLRFPLLRALSTIDVMSQTQVDQTQSIPDVKCWASLRSLCERRGAGESSAMKARWWRVATRCCSCARALGHIPESHCHGDSSRPSLTLNFAHANLIPMTQAFNFNARNPEVTVDWI